MAPGHNTHNTNLPHQPRRPFSAARLAGIAFMLALLASSACDRPPSLPETDDIPNELRESRQTTRDAATSQFERARETVDQTKKPLDPDAG
jgi:hypothetical protein